MPKKNCVHCGNECTTETVEFNGEFFCCSGCKSVYEILNQKNLYTYYRLNPSPGVKETGNFKDKFAYLDTEEIANKLYTFSEGSTRKITLYIPAVHCSSCIWLLENLYKINNAVLSSSINFTKKELTVVFNVEQLTLRQLVELLSSLHYTPLISLKDSNRKAEDSSHRTLLYKIGIAAFCFGNIMLLSMPEYMPGSEHMAQEFKNFFSYIIFALAIPTLLYSGNDYLISAYKNISKGIINIDFPIAIGMLALFVQSAYDIIFTDNAGYFDSLAGLVFFLLLGKLYQSKSYRALAFDRDYKSYFPIAVTRITEKSVESILLENLNIGDRIRIRNGELLPADSILTKGIANIDYSFVTGESSPIQKYEGDLIFAGGRQVGSAIELRVEKTVKQSYLTQLWNDQSDKETPYKSLNSTVDGVAKYFTIAIILISLGGLFYWLVNDSSRAIYAFTSVLIVACPCALALSLPFTFGNGMRILGHKGLYLKSANIMEALSKLSHLVFDKTGTITVSNDSEVHFTGKEITQKDLEALSCLASQSTHPLSKIIASKYPHSKSISFTNYKETAGQGIQAEYDNVLYKLGNMNFVGYSAGHEGFLSSSVFVSVGSMKFGYFSFNNKYRQGLQGMVDRLSKQVKLHLVSGDNSSERETISRIFPDGTPIHFEQKPTDKKKYIQSLQRTGEVVGMLGDGLNDAGALQTSSVGIAIADDIHSFSPACDAILYGKSFEKLPQFLEFAKANISIVRVSFLISFLYNIVGLFYAIQGLLSPIYAAILMPLSSVTVVGFATFSTNLISRKLLA